MFKIFKAIAWFSFIRNSLTSGWQECRRKTIAQKRKQATVTATTTTAAAATVATHRNIICIIVSWIWHILWQMIEKKKSNSFSNMAELKEWHQTWSEIVMKRSTHRNILRERERKSDGDATITFPTRWRNGKHMHTNCPHPNVCMMNVCVV